VSASACVAGQDKNRADIQALRGLAVLLVVVYHARLGAPASGFLGVDIFFVISGFLITGLVKAGIEQGTFTFRDFYFRRAKRLLPAAYVTFLITILCAPFILGTSELRDLTAQVAGALSFSANIVLWQQSGYFEGAAELKPLLHVWSLSLEEQYYFLLPATLVLIPRRLWLRATILIAIASLGLCLALIQWKPIATFYLLPTRAWELAIGSLGAFLIAQPQVRTVARRLFWPSLVLLISLPFVAVGGRHPGLPALLICIATVVVILDGRLARNTSKPLRSLARIGDLSYSLYLVHWPIFAFMNNAWVGETPGELPLELGLAAMAASFPIAWLLHRLVEEPMRRARIAFSWSHLRQVAIVSLALAILPLGLERAFAFDVPSGTFRETQFGLDPGCELSHFQVRPACMTSTDPEVLVWGDSFAMHVIAALRSGAQASLLQVTRSACGPLAGIAPVERNSRKGYDAAWARTCIDFNDAVLEYLKTASTIRTVVLSSPFRGYLDGELFDVLVKSDSLYVQTHPDPDLALKHLAGTIAQIRTLGLKVIIIAPPPSSGFNVGACLERLQEEKLILGAPQDCIIDEKDYRERRSRVLAFLNRIENEGNVSVIRFDALLCDGTKCRTTLEGTPLYRDSAHLSDPGSALLGTRLALFDQVERLAR